MPPSSSGRRCLSLWSTLCAYDQHFWAHDLHFWAHDLQSLKRKIKRFFLQKELRSALSFLFVANFAFPKIELMIYMLILWSTYPLFCRMFFEILWSRDLILWSTHFFCLFDVLYFLYVLLSSYFSSVSSFILTLFSFLSSFFFFSFVCLLPALTKPYLFKMAFGMLTKEAKKENNQIKEQEQKQKKEKEKEKKKN